MKLDDNLVNEFADYVNTETKKPSELCYGMVTRVPDNRTIPTGGSITSWDYEEVSVLLDGASEATPVQTGVYVSVGDRVSVRIENHRATIIGNISSPGTTDGQRLINFAALTDDRIQAAFIEADYASINYLQANYASINYLEANYIDANTMRADYLTANQIRADYITAYEIGAIYVKTTDLEADYINADTIEANFAKIDLANISDGTIKTAMIDTGAIKTAQIADGSVTDAKIVGLTASKITAGTIDAAEIAVINLNAANITVGTINGTQIAGNAIGMEQLSIPVSTLINDASSNASDALSTARTKNRVYHTPTTPTDTDLITGDTWFDTSDGFKMYRYQAEQLTDQNGNTLTDQNGNTLCSGVSWIEERFNTGAIAVGAITTDLLAANSVTGNKIVSREITADKIAAKTITANEIAANTITAGEIKAGTITSTQIAAGTIKASNIEAGTITGDRIKSGTITADKINVSNLFAQTISATGTISGVTLTGAKVTADSMLAKQTYSIYYSQTNQAKTVIQVGAAYLTDGVQIGDVSDDVCFTFNPKTGRITTANTINCNSILASYVLSTVMYAMNFAVEYPAPIGQGTLTAGTFSGSNSGVYLNANFYASSFIRNSDSRKAICSELVTEIEFTYNGGNSYFHHNVTGYGAYGVSAWASDKRLKKNIQKSEVNATKVLEQIEVSSFDWKNGGAHVEVGLVADDVAKVIPNAVFEVGEDKTKNLSPGGIIPYLIKAVQELSDRLDAIER